MKKLINKLQFILIILSMFIGNVYASSKVTKENLESSLKEYYNNADEKGEVEVTDDTIKIIQDNKTYIYNYVIDDDKVTFTNKTHITKGMSYDEYESAMEYFNNISFPGYVSVANIYGIDNKDATAYILTQVLDTIDQSLGNIKYLIVGEDVECSGESELICIKESEFGNYVLDFYKSNSSLDFTDKNNTFKWTNIYENETEDGLDAISTLVVNTNADFSKLEGSFDKLSQSLDDMFNEVSEKLNKNSETKSTSNEENKVENPKTLNNSYFVLSFIFVISLLTFVLSFKRKLIRKI